MSKVIQNAIQDFMQAKAGLLHAFSKFPDERLNWSPSESARTPIQQIVHSAESIGNIHGFLDGRTFDVPTTAEADQGFREFERTITTREEALALLENKSAAFLSWLEGLSPDRLSSMVTTPFGMGQVPTELAITFPAMHTRWHHAQLDYMQTIYGDRDWHM